MSNEAYLAGRKAGYEGGEAELNPYAAGSAERGHWLNGWHIGRNEARAEDLAQRRVRRPRKVPSSAPTPRRDPQGGFKW